MSNLKSIAIKGVFWSAVERFSAQGVQFVLGIILARLLTPHDYGLVGMIAIFISISQVFVLSGFGAALIQKKDRDEKDFSTTLYYNIAVAIFFYILLFLFAPYIANFYNEPLLIKLTRAISFTFVIEAFAVVQRAIFAINVDFKSQSKATLTSVIVSGIVGIALGYLGYGVWALVSQSLIKGFVNVLLLWSISKWVPNESFSYERFKKLFFFGSKLLMSGILNSFAQNISKIAIGKAFSSQMLGFYTRANQFAAFPSVNLYGALGRVTFPILCKFQDDKEELRRKHSEIVKVLAIIIFPLMVGLISLARPLIIVMLTDKWLDSIWMLRIISVGLLLLPINSLNVSLFGIIGRTDMFFKSDLVKQVFIIGILFVSILFGISAILWGQVLAIILTYVVNLFFIKKHYGSYFIKQPVDFIPIMMCCGVMAIVVHIVTQSFQQEAYQLMFGFFSGAIVYLGLIWTLNIRGVKTILMEILNKRRN